MQKEEKTAFSQTADALLENTITIYVDILKPTWWQRLRNQTRRSFQIQPSSLATLVKISKELLSIDIPEVSNMMELTQKLMVAHSVTMAKIIAYAIVNSRDEPPESLIDFLRYNLTAKEMSTVAKYVFEQMDITSFTTSIVSIKGLSLPEMSLNNHKR